MKYFNFENSITFLFFILASCSPTSNAVSENQLEGIVYQERDREIVENILQQLSDDKNKSVSELVVEVGLLLKNTPYVANTLETPKEELVVNVRELDCTTFAENALAIANAVKSENPSFEEFAGELQKVRYRNGEIDEYPSRLHYFSDWIYNNQEKGLVKNVSKELAETPYSKKINFMSTHPESYNQLKNNNEMVERISNQENEISKREMYYIPEDKISEVEDKLKDGDIAGITTNIGGLDISHVVILKRNEDGRIHLLHASSAAHQVIVSNETLEEYLKNSKSATGIMVARPL